MLGQDLVKSEGTVYRYIRTSFKRIHYVPQHMGSGNIDFGVDRVGIGMTLCCLHNIL